MFNATFDFVGRNPPSILIMGGILFLLIGVMGSASGLPAVAPLINWGIGILILGVLIHLVWLFLGRFR